MKKRKVRSIVKSHLANIGRALLEGEKRPAFLEYLKQQGGGRGLYALYDKRGRLYYTGKASELSRGVRLNQHLKDRHSESWEKMSLFFLDGTAEQVSELEGLLIATAKPKGNKQRPHIGKDLRSALYRYVKEDELGQLKGVIYPDKKQKKDRILARITSKKLKQISQVKLAETLKISQGRVSQLISEDNRNYNALREYISAGGYRDRIILLLEDIKVKKRT